MRQRGGGAKGEDAHRGDDVGRDHRVYKGRVPARRLLRTRKDRRKTRTAAAIGGLLCVKLFH